MHSAKIFSIEEFSTYDGPGIRMTVFLKGCPLHCVWCHNPEGQNFGVEIGRSPNGCVGCSACLDAGEKETGKRKLTFSSIAACKRGLVRQIGEEYTSDRLIELVEKNADILNAAGGGVTFSGGEPLCNYDFLIECLKGLRGKVHRAVQSCGYAEGEKFLSVASECELVLYDLKLMDDEKHRYYTGVSNAQILENYRSLCRSGKEMLTRIPLIPTVNDTEENLRRTASFMAENKQRRVELLPYNKFAGAKYRLVGREYAPDFDENADVRTHREIFEEYGIEVSVL